MLVTPRDAEQNEQIREERREQIRAAARKVFARKGLAATKISDIAAEAGLSHGLIYHYFKTKDEVFHALVEQAAQGAIWVFRTALAQPGSPWDRLEWAARAMMTGLNEEPEYWLIVVQALTNDSVPVATREALLQNGHVAHQLLAELIRQGQAAGQVVPGDPEQLAVLLTSCVQGLAISLAARFEVPFPSPEMVLRALKA